MLLATSFAAGAPMQRCEDSAAGSWIADLQERMLSLDLLGRDAVQRFGAPTACVGEVTAEFDGIEFGRLRFEFQDDAVLEVETFPPESSRVALTAHGGFPDDTEARRLLRAYVDKVGVGIDWSAAEIAKEGATTIETWWSADTDLNASAQVVSTDGKITSLRFSMAL